MHWRISKLSPLLVTLMTLASCANVPDVEKLACDCSDSYPYPKVEGPLACGLIPQHSDSPFRNLVLHGGGVKGIAYAGALDVLVRRGDLNNIERVAGTSAGAITAGLLAVGYEPCAVANFTMDFDFKALEDGSFVYNALHAVETFGWYKGNYFQCAMECAIDRQGFDKKLTFAGLHEQAQSDNKYKDLYVVATNLNTEQAVTFSHEDHPTMPIADAVRMSMSIPFFFEARRYLDDVFVDGGIVRDYPIDIFDNSRFCEPGDRGNNEATYCVNKETLGLFLGDRRNDRYGTRNLHEYINRVMSVMAREQVVELCNNAHDIGRTVFIDTSAASATDFSLSKAKKLALVNAGRQCTSYYLQEPTDSCPDFMMKPGSTDSCYRAQ